MQTRPVRICNEKQRPMGLFTKEAYANILILAKETFENIQCESLKDCTGSTCEGLGSGSLIPFTSIITTAQQSDLLPTCQTQVQLSVHQMAHERKRIRSALARRWQSRQEPLVVPATLVETTTTQVQLSPQNMAHKRRRSRAALATWKPSTNLVPVTGQILQASPAQHTSGVRKPLLVHDPTGPHIPSMFAAMVCTAVAHGSEWLKRRYWWTLAASIRR